MNRKQRRWLMRKMPGYRNLLSQAAAKSYEEFENMMKEQWEKLSEKSNDTEKINNETNRDNQSSK